MTKNKGFSLLELIIVMFLIGVISSLVPPVLNKAIKGLRFRTSAKKLSSYLNYAKSEAISKKRPVTFFLDTSDNVSWLAYGLDRANSMVEKKYFYKNIKITYSKIIDRLSKKNILKKEKKTDKHNRFSNIQKKDAVAGIKDSAFKIIFYPNGVSTGGKFIIRQDNDKGPGESVGYFEIYVDIFTSKVTCKEFTTAA